MGTFAFLLIIADDTQEWGRKFITELYISSGNKYEPGEIDMTISQGDLPSHNCKLQKKMLIPDKKGPRSGN
jgi:hypothetical protein